MAGLGRMASLADKADDEGVRDKLPLETSGLTALAAKSPAWDPTGDALAGDGVEGVGAGAILDARYGGVGGDRDGNGSRLTYTQTCCGEEDSRGSRCGNGCCKLWATSGGDDDGESVGMDNGGGYA